MNNSKEIHLLFLLIEMMQSEKEKMAISSFETLKSESKNSEVLKLVLEISISSQVDAEEIYKIYHDIAKDACNVYHIGSKDILEGIERKFITFRTYNIEDFLKTYVTKDVSFHDLFQFVDKQTRINFLWDKYICNYEIYHTRDINYLILFEVDEEKIRLFKKRKACCLI